MGGKSVNKAAYFDKLENLLKEFKSIFIVTVDNVSSQQMHEIRQSLRGEGVVLMGKNTMVCLLPHYAPHQPRALAESTLKSDREFYRFAVLSRASSMTFLSTRG